MFGTNFPCMRHPASRLEVIIHSRADTRNAVKSAAYTARSIFIDERFGTRFRATKKGGLLSHELINWPGDTAALWNAAERAEKAGSQQTCGSGPKLGMDVLPLRSPLFNGLAPLKIGEMPSASTSASHEHLLASPMTRAILRGSHGSDQPDRFARSGLGYAPGAGLRPESQQLLA